MYKGLPGAEAKRGSTPFRPVGPETPADAAGAGLKIFFLGHGPDGARVKIFFRGQDPTGAGAINRDRVLTLLATGP